MGKAVMYLAEGTTRMQRKVTTTLEANKATVYKCEGLSRSYGDPDAQAR